jgi:thiol:disulfide interchange protein DsbC
MHQLKIRLLCVLSIVSALLASPVMAEKPQVKVPTLLSDVTQFGEIVGMRRLDTVGFQLVELSNGKLVLVSADGHYAILGGRMMDFWNSREIKSLADLSGSQRIPLSRLPMDDLGTVKVGKGPMVGIFIDPLSPTTAQVLEAVEGLKKEYSFNLILVPSNDDRKEMTRRLLCVSSDKAYKAMLSGLKKDVKVKDDDCGREQLQRNYVTAMMFSIKQVPFIIASNGMSSKGLPNNFQEFLKNNVPE